VNLMTQFARSLQARDPELVVVVGLGDGAVQHQQVADSPSTLYLLGAMGMAIPLALGMALADPGQRVLVIEGDGAVLMNLGGLATVTRYGPGNLAIAVVDNGGYQTTGGQSTSLTLAPDGIAGVAISLGLKHVRSFTADDGGDTAAAWLLDGPGRIGILISDEKPKPGPPVALSPAGLRERFTHALRQSPETELSPR
jgi:sulfopyruvate decarboxylase subunit beta